MRSAADGHGRRPGGHGVLRRARRRGEGAARVFFTAVADGDGAGVCELLAPSTRSGLESSSGAPCAQAVLEEVDAAESAPEVAVYGDAARVRVGSETAFLALLDGGWWVMAAGCSAPPAEDLPYDCSVSGG